MLAWRQLPLSERIRWLRYFLPPALAVVVVIYQLGVARTLAETYGHAIHYTVEIAFYSLTGPAVSWLTLVWVERGVREREVLERQVRARTQQLAGLTAASADAIFSLDSAGRIASWNAGAQRMLGYAEDEVVGRGLDELLPAAAELARRLAVEGVVQDFETLARTSDGQTVTVDLSQTRMPEAADGSPISLIIMRDVTARRERAAIVEEERARIARDLHDSVAQTLYFLALKADQNYQQVATQPAEVAADLDEMGKQIRAVIREVRRTVFALRALDWSEGGFLPALERFVSEFAEQVGWLATFEAAPLSAPVPLRLEPTIFRLVQESLNNVAKHAGARRVAVRLHHAVDPACLILSVRDDGSGFDPAAVNGGFGLVQMGQRVETQGGHLHVESQPGQGTIITAEFPLKNAR
ncbi:MAG: histidine kinase [Anaerolineales bacterium]